MNLKERIENDKLYQLLLKIQNRPNMYLAEEDLNNLYWLIIGYNLYRHLNNIETDIDILAVEGKITFDEYVHNYYNDITTHNWFDLINYHMSNKKYALKEFFKLLFMYIDYCIKE